MDKLTWSLAKLRAAQKFMSVKQTFEKKMVGENASSALVPPPIMAQQSPVGKHIQPNGDVAANAQPANNVPI